MATFQDLRVKLHPNLSKKPSTTIFANKSIKNDDEDQYAFHLGGRKEIQYNIGFITEDGEEKFRYGIAFSFEKNQTLKDPAILKKQFNRFIEYLNENKSRFQDYKLYSHADEREDRDFIDIEELSEEHSKENMFIFFGKIIPENKIDFDEILTTFDKLLEIYIYVEGSDDIDKGEIRHKRRRKNKVDITENVEKAIRKITAKTIESDLLHKKFQKKIYRILCEKYGEENVYPEYKTDIRTSIDLVVDNSECFYYEIKTYKLLRPCLREALGQLIEYAYWSNRKKPDKLIIVSENSIKNDDEAKNFLKTLREQFKLNVYYQQFDFEDNTLSELY